MIEEAGVERSAQIDFETFQNIVGQTEMEIDLEIDVDMSPQHEENKDMQP